AIPRPAPGSCEPLAPASPRRNTCPRAATITPGLDTTCRVGPSAMSKRPWRLGGVLGGWWLGVLGGRGAEAADRPHELPGAGPRWLGSSAEARRAARDSGKPIFAVFRCEH